MIENNFYPVRMQKLKIPQNDKKLFQNSLAESDEK